MLIDISVGSRYHAFDLARELDRHAVMRTLHTGYPATSAGRFGLRRAMMRSVWTYEPLNRLVERVYRLGLLKNVSSAWLNRRFDRIVARRLKPGADIFVGWSSHCLQSLRRARALGMVTVVERGSAHILCQQRILNEERALTGRWVEVPSDEMVRLELAEYAEAMFISVPSGFVARTFQEHGVPAEKLIINPYGVDLTKFNASKPADNPSGLRVIHVGGCGLRKGVHYLARAVGLVPNASLTFVGGLDPGIRPLIEHPWTTLVGPVPGDALPGYYAQADVFCLLSVEDGFGMVITQAMAAGLPVIVSSNTGGPDLVTDGVEGYVVPIRSPEKVAEKLQLLRDDPALRQAMGRRARERVQRGFSWRDYGDRAVAHYRRILSD